jgi:hypothetical protein
MFGRVRVFAGMPIRRAIAAKRYAACLAGAQMGPKRNRSSRILRIRAAAAASGIIEPYSRSI